MLKSSDLFHIPFYKKTHYTGSISGMRYLIEKASKDGADIFQVWIFPGPFCFEKTASNLKESKAFVFSEDSIPAIADWLNQQYTERISYWNQNRSPVH